MHSNIHESSLGKWSNDVVCIRTPTLVSIRQKFSNPGIRQKFSNPGKGNGEMPEKWHDRKIALKYKNLRE